MSETTIPPLSKSRFRGCLLGLAVGDAVGTAVEFMPPGSFIPLKGMIGGGRFNLAPGEWTDDTSMALCLAESLIEKQAFDPIDQLERYLRWYRTGYLSSNGRCFDIGITTCNALHRFEHSHEPYPGPTAQHTAGSGSLMRLAPVPMFYARHPTLAIEKCADSSRTTHANLKAVDACRFFGVLLLGALSGYTKEELLSPLPLVDDLHADVQWVKITSLLPDLEPEIAEVARGSYKLKQPPAIVGSGYVTRCMEAALWAFYNSTSFRQGCLLAANLGDDADTTAAIYGQLAGAYYGVDSIPAVWRARLVKADMIINYADRLWESAQRV